MKIQTRKLSQEKAFLKFLEIVKDDIWIKLGHKSFLKGIRKNQEISLYKTHKKNNDPKTRTIGAKINQPYKFLREWSNQNNNGVLFIPCYCQKYPLKSDCNFSRLISAEMDYGTLEEQWLKIEEVSEKINIRPNLIIYSGNKSLHVHWIVKLTPTEKIKELRETLSMLLLSDRAANHPILPLRLPGFHRKETGKEQTILYHRKKLTPLSLLSRKLEKISISNHFPYQSKRVYQTIPIIKKVEKSSSLLLYLTRHDRELIESGCQFYRNNNGFKLAANLIGTYNYLISQGIYPLEHPKDLFLKFCQNCPQEDWKLHEWETIWKSANSRHPNPSKPIAIT